MIKFRSNVCRRGLRSWKSFNWLHGRGRMAVPWRFGRVLMNGRTMNCWTAPQVLRQYCWLMLMIQARLELRTWCRPDSITQPFNGQSGEQAV